MNRMPSMLLHRLDASTHRLLYDLERATSYMAMYDVTETTSAALVSEETNTTL